jgi:hypothetical protein
MGSFYIACDSIASYINDWVSGMTALSGLNGRWRTGQFLSPALTIDVRYDKVVKKLYFLESAIKVT